GSTCSTTSASSWARPWWAGSGTSPGCGRGSPRRWCSPPRSCSWPGRSSRRGSPRGRDLGQFDGPVFVAGQLRRLRHVQRRQRVLDRAQAVRAAQERVELGAVGAGEPGDEVGPRLPLGAGPLGRGERGTRAEPDGEGAPGARQFHAHVVPGAVVARALDGGERAVVEGEQRGAG